MKNTLLTIIVVFVCACQQNTDYQSLFRLALDKSEEGNYSDAIDLLDNVISIKPNFDSAYAERAYNYLQKNEPDKALLDADKAIDIQFGNIDAFYIRGLIYSSLNQYENAIQDFTHIIKMGDSIYTIMALKERGNLLHLTHLSNNNMELAIADFTEIIKIDSAKL